MITARARGRATVGGMTPNTRAELGAALDRVLSILDGQWPPPRTMPPIAPYVRAATIRNARGYKRTPRPELGRERAAQGARRLDAAAPAAPAWWTGDVPAQRAESE